MTEKDRIEYAKSRIEHANQCVETASVNAEHGDYKAAANRSYYAVFHAMRAALALVEEKEQSRHTGVSSEFRRIFIKTGQLPISLSNIITEAFEVRNECDYDDFYVISKAEVEDQIKRSQTFVNIVKDYLLKKGIKV